MTASETPVRKSVTVQASVDKAFRVFTEGFDTWVGSPGTELEFAL